ncbi:hypothetical protein PLICRDRAFT_120116, partial [Plicaturopsis crispa FD-325 SS-3]
SGARAITLGNFPIHFSMLRDIAEHPLGPLFLRDVERGDKQDDRAAARLFAAETLNCLLSHFPKNTSLSVYLLVLGELYDAWQNRNIGHAERAKMVLRALLPHGLAVTYREASRSPHTYPLHLVRIL